MTDPNEQLISQTVAASQPLNGQLDGAIQARLDSLTKPPGSLGELETLAARICRIQGTTRPSVDAKVVLVFAADHGVAQEGVSAFPPAVTPQMVLNFVAGGAAVNVLARQAGARVVVIDMGVNHTFDPATEGLLVRNIRAGTDSIIKGPAMRRAEAFQAIAVGIEVANAEMDAGVQLIAAGDMGIGNTTSSAAITACLTGTDPQTVTGRGTGVDDAAWAHKVEVVRQALAINRPDARDGVGVLATLGGFEIGAICGAMLAAAARRVPVLLDGYIATAGALIAQRLCPHVTDYLLAGHRSVEPGHQVALAHLGLRPLLTLDLRLGEGSGAVLAMHLAEAAVRVINDMATFADAGVAGKA